jgi:hypothetical protein
MMAEYQPPNLSPHQSQLLSKIAATIEEEPDHNFHKQIRCCQSLSLKWESSSVNEEPIFLVLIRKGEPVQQSGFLYSPSIVSTAMSVQKVYYNKGSTFCNRVRVTFLGGCCQSWWSLDWALYLEVTLIWALCLKIKNHAWRSSYEGKNKYLFWCTTRGATAGGGHIIIWVFYDRTYVCPGHYIKLTNGCPFQAFKDAN